MNQTKPPPKNRLNKNKQEKMYKPDQLELKQTRLNWTKSIKPELTIELDQTRLTSDKADYIEQAKLKWNKPE